MGRNDNVNNNAIDKVIALAGNPNVGKSTVFNALTGLRQHTGNWPGKTVTQMQGYCTYKKKRYMIMDLPGCYSLMAHSAEEEVARDFICCGSPDAVIVVCDATCLERSLNLVLQTLEITSRVVVCVNLLDEAKKKKIHIKLQELSQRLGVPVIGTAARSKKGLEALMEAVTQVLDSSCGTVGVREGSDVCVQYPDYIEAAISALEARVQELCADTCPRAIESRWVSLMLLQQGLDVDRYQYTGNERDKDSAVLADDTLAAILRDIKGALKSQGISQEHIQDDIVSSVILAAEYLYRKTVIQGKDMSGVHGQLSTADRILTGKWTAFPIMIAALLGIFWLTITGANYPSQLISDFLFWIEDHLLLFFEWLHAPEFLTEMLVLGVYRALAWVVAVMLPPMAIFFPLFTLLEDIGFLPRIAFNLDKWFKKCSACGKQALTMCMGFGCNAAGVIGCRIIDSPRERLIAILTNNFVPCNGRFPTLIALISMFFVGTMTVGGAAGERVTLGIGSSVLSAGLLTAVIVLGVCMTFVVSKFLSKTLLKGTPSSFTLELPPYRRPQIGKVIIRSLLDRTLFVLGRAVCMAAPAGLVIWLMANIMLGDKSLLLQCSDFLDPFGRLLGMDGVILLAFILGFPANEIVIPIMIMAYMAQGNILEIDNLNTLKELLVAHGWTWVTAISVMLFSLMHWPCSTTCLTIKKETQSLKWTLVSMVAPTVVGMAMCFVFALLARGFVE
ncbi:MAG: ferrous iron transport protein B [Peptococcaceae bacterium]|nr:ferrous iron transport protein B [Peptococcaceae bacterium]